MNSKGISPLIAGVLLVAFTMAVAGLFSSWAPGLLQDIQGDTGEDTSDLLDATRAGLGLDSATLNTDSGNTSVVFRNTGEVSLSNFTVTARLEDGFVQRSVDKTVASAGIVSVELNTTGAPNLVRVDSDNLDVSAQTEDVVLSLSGNDGSSVDFQLSGVSDNGPVTEGDTVSVDYTVSNDGGVSGSQDITLDVEGVQEDVNSSVSLGSGGSSSGVLEWVTESGDSGSNIGYTVSTKNDSVSGSVDVDSLSGPTASASKNVSNPEVGESVKFIGSDSTSGDGSISTYKWDVDGNGSYEYTSSSPNVTHSYSSNGTKNVELNVTDTNDIFDSDSLMVDVKSAADLNVVRDSDSGYVNEGEVFEVNYSVENTGGKTGSETVELSVNGSTVDTNSVSVDAYSTFEGTLEWSVGTGDAGIYNSEFSYSSGSETLQAAAAPNNNWAFVNVSDVPSDMMDTSSMNDFFVMRFEARNDGNGNPVSRASGSPWATLSMNDAIQQCESLNDGYGLISDRQWNAISHQAMDNPNNWADEDIGSSISEGGGLYSGNTGNSNSVSYNGPEPDSGTNNEMRRTLELANGEKVWDMSGNVEEFTSNSFKTLNGEYESPRQNNAAGDESWHEFTEITAWNGLPSSTAINSSWSASEGIGRIYLNGDTTWTNTGNDGEISVSRRGGSWGKGKDAGVHATNLFNGPSREVAYTGFRCTLR